ncbi:hypothetical protein [Stackebrandtia nassauensis]|uniref:Uncharacterized protein n=1 Tax=Stackebrandtia nassauensis (strain DSM 44728 / CIP 108903 / NRRL B-16338 / NBRC 102104 / LLR-40K-21) TaxID=446470 RepID=D3Q6X9_STANL|nr:hypothetical protein [Stackebrandtia nassauensis]ADD40378.1 hypothetical protein Snas_0665 [Stackebrandtia nassauensis DSM 44728]
MKLIRDKPVEVAAATGALVLCLLFGNGWFTTWLFARLGELNVPSALGIPAALPALRLWPLGTTTWWQTITETLAAAFLVAMVALWVSGTRTRHPDAGAARLFLSGWLGTIVAAMSANAIRAVVASFDTRDSIGVYTGHALAALAFGLLWGLVTGWLIAIAAVLARRGVT